MHQTVIRSTRGWAGLQLDEVWRYRELVAYLAWRDILVRYKQTLIGVAWALLRPLVTMLAFTVVFGKIGKFPSGGVPYVLLTFSGLLAWQLFSTAFSESSGSVVANQNMISKVYFPRLVIPISSVFSSVIDFVIMMLFLVPLMLWFGVPVSRNIIFLPLFALLVLLTALGVGILFSALFVKYRDVRHVVPFVVQIGLYVSPVAFASTIVPENWRPVYALNPLVAAIDGFRWSLFGVPSLRPGETIMAFAIAIALVVGGTFYFRQTERTFADLI